ncbi:J domain-containing protein [Streptomyces chryseus]|uniref:J domain-containing protein n=1 Tax=Streptomyces chryseus TaxID=68186 RepID=UPI00110F9A14|nr:J domain-containing protein [Streptomyces chryseus]
MGEERLSLCQQCSGRIEWVAARESHWRDYCSDACKQRAYRDRRREEAEQARRAWEEHQRWQQEEQRQRREQEQRRQEEERRRRQEEQARRSKGSTGAGQQRNAGAEYRRPTTAAEARAVVFSLAGLRDDGTVTLKKAYREAFKRWHTDTNGTAEAKEMSKRLGEALALLQRLNQKV